MRIVTLNTWGGRKYEELMTWIRRVSVFTDVFCFQEVFFTLSDEIGDESYRANLFQEIQSALEGTFIGFFTASERGYTYNGPVNDFEINYGTAMFVRNTIAIAQIGSIAFPFPDEGFESNHSRCMQYMTLNGVLVANFHGLWNGRGKNDTPDRIMQSEILVDFFHAFAPDQERILCTDLNLDPNTTSIKMLERALVNVNRRFGLPCTRSSLYCYPDKSSKKEDYPHADYIFISNGIQIKSFNVLVDCDFSDHLPLTIEIY